MRRTQRNLGPALRFSLALLLVGLAAAAALAPATQDQLRYGDRLLQQGRYYEALGVYSELATQAPELPALSLRLGLLRLVRNETKSAVPLLFTALQTGLYGPERATALLGLGAALQREGQTEQAASFYAQLRREDQLEGARLVLDAEQALAAADYAAAQRALEAALQQVLPADWQLPARQRLALLVALDQPQQALSLLGRVAAVQQSPDPLLTLLRPASWSTEQLLAALSADAVQRPQLLGQLYLGIGWYPLAEQALASVDRQGPLAQQALAFQAYTLWLAGQREAGLTLLEALAANRPADAAAGALLALAYLQHGNLERAEAQLLELRNNAPNDPATALAWTQWYISRREYPAALAEQARAIAVAPPERQGVYELAAAQVHLALGYELCGAGLAHGQRATQLQPASLEARLLLARANLSCGDPAAALQAASVAQALAPESAEAAFYLGVSAARLGDQATARQAFLRAADLAPASDWRVRAEERLALLR